MISRAEEKAPRPAASAAREERAIQEAVAGRDLVGSLSARERDVLAARARGLLVKQIAAELGLAEGTVRVLLTRGIHKLLSM